MAFEIYNGTGSAVTMFNKLVEMWDFDSVDTSEREAVYGSGKIKAYSDYIRLYKVGESSYINNTNTGTGANFTIIKSENAIMLTWVYSNTPYCYIVGNLTKVIDGTADKGMTCNEGSYIYSIMGTIVQSTITQSPVNTDALWQMVEVSGTEGGFYFGTVYRFISTAFVDPNTIQGLYDINGERYFVCASLAIKEE
jgi:hypothetical protein